MKRTKKGQVKQKSQPAASPFVAQLKREVAAIAREFSVPKHRAFAIWFGRLTFGLNEEESVEATGVEGANDKNIDLFWIDTENEKVVIVQTKYGDAGKYNPSIKEVDGLYSSLNWLTSPVACRNDGKPDLEAIANDYLEAMSDGYGVEFWFVYSGPKCPNVDKHIAVYNQNPEHIDNRRSCRHCDIALIKTYYDDHTGGSKRLETETIQIIDGKHFQYDA